MALVVMSVPLPYEVAMATYNGEAFLEAQLCSIQGQTWLPQRILVADDGSVDQTIEILRVWERRTNGWLTMLPHASHCGSSRTFERALEATISPYVLLADQDDVWDIDKAERLLRLMVAAESKNGFAVPLLVHTDLRLINSSGVLLAPSFFRYSRLDPYQGSWQQLALQNVVTGCASALNRALLEKALPFPDVVVLHDWWLGLVAVVAGSLEVLPEPCLSYRQHRNNLVGARGCRQLILQRLVGLVSTGRHGLGRWVGMALLQLQACAVRCPEQFSTYQHECIRELSSTSRVSCLRAIVSLRLQKQGPLRMLYFLLALLLAQRAPYGHLQPLDPR